MLPVPTVLVTLDVAAHHAREQAADGQPEPGAGLRLRDAERAALERREDALEVGCLNAGAGVDHLELGDRAAIMHDELHAAGLRELDGVGQQVDQDLAQPLLVGIDHDRQHRRPLEDEIDALGGGLQAEHADQLVEELAEANLVARQIQPAGLDLGDVEHAVDQAGQMIGAAADDADLVARLRRQAGVLLQQLRVAEDRVQRRAQFVAEADDIAALGEIGGLGDLLGALQFGVGALVRVDLLHQQRGLPPRFRLRRAPALLRQHEQPGDHADDDGQREEHLPQHVGQLQLSACTRCRGLQVDQAERQPDQPGGDREHAEIVPELRVDPGVDRLRQQLAERSRRPAPGSAHAACRDRGSARRANSTASRSARHRPGRRPCPPARTCARRCSTGSLRCSASCASACGRCSICRRWPRRSAARRRRRRPARRTAPAPSRSARTGRRTR